VKLPLYARAGIPEVWIAALDDDVLHVYRQPSPDGYADHTVLHRGDTIRVETLPEAGTFAVADVLGA